MSVVNFLTYLYEQGSIHKEEGKYARDFLDDFLLYFGINVNIKYASKSESGCIVFAIGLLHTENHKREADTIEQHFLKIWPTVSWSKLELRGEDTVFYFWSESRSKINLFANKQVFK